MKKIILFGAAAAALVAMPALAQQAQGGFNGGAGVTRAQVETRTRAMFARVDVNRDGFVTQAEAQSVRGAIRARRNAERGERREALFARLDSNRDGEISRAEFFAPRQQAEGGERRGVRAERRAERMERRGNRGLRFGARAFERMDMNKDGRVSLAEMTELRIRAFTRADVNRDGRVTPEERRSLRAARQNRRG